MQPARVPEGLVPGPRARAWPEAARAVAGTGFLPPAGPRPGPGPRPAAELTPKPGNCYDGSGQIEAEARPTR
jgi:hypothetical protein